MGNCCSRLRERSQRAAAPEGTAVGTTKWKVAVDTSVPNQPSATLSLSVNGGNFQPLKTKGICYSPCPLNGSNKYAPNIGDWFWDSYSGPITGWEALWQRDLPNIRALGANTLRIYSILSRQLTYQGGFPNPWDSGHLFTHTSFLDMCWNGGTDPLYVLVGIPLPQAMFWKSDYSNISQEEKTFWEKVLAETTNQVGSHPAVLGFVIQNEHDSNVVTYPNSNQSNKDDVIFWWSQVQKLALIAKENAPDKLVGMAVHDDPNIPGKAAPYMATCPSIDYWGVNTYQPKSFNSIFDGIPGEPGYAYLNGAALKPVILTEYGFPSTTRSDELKPLEIHSTEATQENVASIVKDMIPQAFQQRLCLGVYYFEYCDEWWSQDGYTVNTNPPTPLKPPNIYTWFGGASAPGFPNGYWDQEGFGLYSIQRGGDLPNDAAIWDQPNNRPTQPIDVHTPRLPVVQAVRDAYTK